MLDKLRKEIDIRPEGRLVRNILLARGLMEPQGDNCRPLGDPSRRAAAFEALMQAKRHIYGNDKIVGSIYGLVQPCEADDLEWADKIVASFGARSFGTNADHFAPDYANLLGKGIGGILDDIDLSMRTHTGKEGEFLAAARRCMTAFSGFVRGYGITAAEAGLAEAAFTCEAVALDPPCSFRQALQLVWLAHIAFVHQGRYAMALGRADQYLYSFYLSDIEAGRLTNEQALDMLCCTLIKIGELRVFGFDDVVNIAIGGVDENGDDSVNELSYLFLEAVRLCNIPGPNLSARISVKTPRKFIKACLKVIGTGLGYPALMNDEVNIAALLRYGYSIKDARNYCMVGCIENFIQGAQPPWSDGRFNTPKYLELALNEGACMQTEKCIGIRTQPVQTMGAMQDVLSAFGRQMEYGALEYVTMFNNENSRYNPDNYTQPFLSCFCIGCIENGRDINNGGAKYPSVHGACLMGIATVADSLAAIEYAVFDKKICTLSELCQALKHNFEGHEALRQELLGVPKYGNNNDFVDKYARWFVSVQYELFSKYRTPDDGYFYLGIASNVANIDAGRVVAATPDGRRSGEPLSDAASPMHGMDENGPTAALMSVSKPDYTKSATGTVVNQKYSPGVFAPDKLDKLCSLVQVYFARGGQELQVNAVSRQVLAEAMEHPEKYSSLVVRVSGFSAYYTCLSPEVQLDILKRTEHDG